MTWNGDISHMGKLASRIADLAAVPSRASRRVAREIRELVEEEFREGADPYGNAWLPLADATLAKRTQTSEPPLTDTGTMRESLDVRPMQGAGVSITIDHPSEDHQTGWSGTQGTGPARPILPAGRMPDLWQEAIDASIDDEVRKAAG